MRERKGGRVRNNIVYIIHKMLQVHGWASSTTSLPVTQLRWIRLVTGSLISGREEQEKEGKPGKRKKGKSGGRREGEGHDMYRGLQRLFFVDAHDDKGEGHVLFRHTGQLVEQALAQFPRSSRCTCG